MAAAQDLKNCPAENGVALITTAASLGSSDGPLAPERPAYNRPRAAERHSTFSSPPPLAGRPGGAQAPIVDACDGLGSPSTSEECYATPSATNFGRAAL